MTYKKGDTLELTIEKTAYGGQGVARLEGFVVFVRNAVPGDRILARIYRKKKSYGEAALVELLTPSPDRVEAPCPHSGHCGGCQWQHLHYKAQLRYKRDQVVESLEHIGGVKEVPVREVIPSERVFGYRNKMEFSFSDRRWFPPHEREKAGTEEGDFVLGLHVPGTFHKVMDISACLLQPEKGNRILSQVKRLTRNSGLPAYGLKSHQGFWRFLMIRHSVALDEWMVNLVTSEPSPRVLRPIVEELRTRLNPVKTVVNNITRRKAAVAVGEEEVVFSGPGFIRDRIGPYTFQVSANSFFQTNPSAAHRLYLKAAEYAELKGTESVLDLYSGTGTIPIFLANRVRTVAGLEIGEAAVADARRNCEENGVENCRFLCGDIRQTLGAVEERPDVTIIDPPRSGMHKDVLDQVLALAPERIVYISCNPATLARDLGRMVGGYEVLEVQPLDMFPHTHHIETVARLRRRNKGPVPMNG